MKTNKRIVTLILIIFTFTLAGCRNTKAHVIKSGKDVTFFIASDTHYLAKNLTDNGKAFQEFVNGGDGKELNYIQEIMNAFENDIKKKKPNVLIISGDLTSNGEKESHLELAKRLKEIEKTGTSVYVIPGNHDILNPYARGFKGGSQYVTDYISDKDFSNIYGDFGYKEAISRDKASLSYLVEPSEDLWLLMLDTAQYENNVAVGSPQTDGRIAPETLQWIKQCSDLAKSKGAQLIAVMHHNLIDHSDTVKEGFTINNSKEAVKVFEECGINLSLSGHIHLQDIKSNGNDSSPIYDIASSCIDVYPQKYGILKYSPKNGLDYSTTSVDVEGWAKEKGIADKNLINFTEYSRNFYGDMVYSKIVSRLALSDDYTNEQLRLMGEAYKLLTLRYYEGERKVATEEIKNSPGFKLWLTDEPYFSNRSILRLSNVNGEVNNKLHIPLEKTSK